MSTSLMMASESPCYFPYLTVILIRTLIIVILLIYTENPLNWIKITCDQDTRNAHLYQNRLITNKNEVNTTRIDINANVNRYKIIETAISIKISIHLHRYCHLYVIFDIDTRLMAAQFSFNS